jgi:hypothetical protein
MALAPSVEESLKEAESHLRNALSFASRGERPFVVKAIAGMISELDSLVRLDQLVDKIDEMSNT